MTAPYISLYTSLEFCTSVDVRNSNEENKRRWRKWPEPMATCEIQLPSFLPSAAASFCGSRNVPLRLIRHCPAGKIPAGPRAALTLAVFLEAGDSNNDVQTAESN